MATKKAQTAKKPAPKATKTVKTSTGKTKTMPAKKPATKPTPKTSAKPTTNKTASTTAPKKSGIGRAIACIVGAIAAVALIVILAIALSNGAKQHSADFTVKDGNGKEITTKYIAFNDKAFRLKIPANFKRLSEDEMKEEFGDEYDYATTAVFHSEDKNAVLAVDWNSSQDKEFTNDQVKEQLDATKSVLDLINVKADTEYYQIADHNVGLIKFTNAESGSNVYSQMMFFAQDNKQQATVAFTCPADQKNKWQTVGEYILKSLDFNK